jgi:GNAT superfamily N-acetyltransferase
MLIKLRNLKRKLYRNHIDYGLFILLRKVVTGILGIFYRNVRTIIYQLDMESNCRVLNHRDNLTFMLINGKDHFSLRKIEEMAEWLEGKLDPDLLTGKRICMGVFDKEKLIGFYVATFGEVFLPILSIKITLKHDEAWGEEIMINKKYRGKGIAGVLKHRIYRELQNRGVRSIYGCVGTYNKASLKSATKFQFKKAYYVRLFKILNSRKIIFTEIPADLRGSGMMKQKGWQCSDMANTNRKTFINKEKFILNLKNKKDEDVVLTIRTSEFCNLVNSTSNCATTQKAS